jgi:hypothetical protein
MSLTVEAFYVSNYKYYNNPVARAGGAGGPGTAAGAGGPNAGGAAGNTDQTSVQNMNPEDYLERANVNIYLRDAISLLLENRPENPILFLADHFRNM